MNAHKRIRFGHLLVFTITLSLYPTAARSQGLVVNCDTGGTIRGALGSLKPGDTLTVIGACIENVAIEAEVSRITLDGRGTARLQSTAPSQNVIAIRGRDITVRGFTISGGNNGIVVQRGGMAVIDGNNIRGSAGSGATSCSCSNGILVGQESSAIIINNTIENNRTGISVDENSSARIGFQVPTALGLPNTIQNNVDVGVHVLHNSSARIIAATIINNGRDGIRVERASHADISGNRIEGNAADGISASGNSAIDLDLGRIQTVAEPNTTDAAIKNGGFGVACSTGSYVSGSLGTLTGAKGAMTVDNTCFDGSGPLVRSLSFAPSNVPTGGTFTATFSGAGLSAPLYFDIRYRAPGSNTDQEVYNWQQGTSASHPVPVAMQTGTYVVTSARAHTDIADHTGPYIPVSATINVLP